MIVYGDRRELLTPALALTRLQDALERVAQCTAGGMTQVSAGDALTELLIEAGTLEQAVADQACPFKEWSGAIAPLVVRLTDVAADGVARTSRPTAPDAAADAAWWAAWRGAVEDLLRGLAAADLPPSMEAILPEGCLFYGLYPDAYLRSMRRHLGSSEARTPHVVVGVRSIGTSLGAMAAAACREVGLPVRRLTVRPRGNPFDRTVLLDGALVCELRALATPGARFILVDEGPGLSGSSLASVARALEEQAGVSRMAMTFLCANGWPGGEAPPWALGYWHTVPRVCVDPHEARAAAARALSGLAGGGRVVADLSGGAWRAHSVLSPDVATSHPRFERHKYLCHDHQGRLLQAKFIGLGRVGRLKARRAAALAARGFVPPVFGYAHGFLFSTQIEAPPLRHDVPPTTAQLDRIAAYLGHLCTLPAPDDLRPPPAGATFDRLHRLVAVNTRAWYAGTLDHELDALSACATPDMALRGGGDGKPQPHEWLAAAPLLKCDAADHHLDHGAVWPVDPAYDLAGTLLEWELDAASAARLVHGYTRAAGDHQVARRLPFYYAVYAAVQLGHHDMAYHLDGGAGAAAARHDAARRRYAAALQDALIAARDGRARASVGAGR